MEDQDEIEMYSYGLYVGGDQSSSYIAAGAAGDVVGIRMERSKKEGEDLDRFTDPKKGLVTIEGDTLVVSFVLTRAAAHTLVAVIEAALDGEDNQS